MLPTKVFAEANKLYVITLAMTYHQALVSYSPEFLQDEKTKKHHNDTADTNLVPRVKASLDANRCLSTRDYAAVNHIMLTIMQLSIKQYL